MFKIGDRIRLKGGIEQGTIHDSTINNIIQVKWDSNEEIYWYCIDFLERIKWKMADITKCKNVDCVKAETCYRVKAIDNPYRQSYFDFTDRCNEETNFDDYIKVIIGGYLNDN